MVATVSEVGVAEADSRVTAVAVMVRGVVRVLVGVDVL